MNISQKLVYMNALYAAVNDRNGCGGGYSLEVKLPSLLPLGSKNFDLHSGATIVTEGTDLEDMVDSFIKVQQNKLRVRIDKECQRHHQESALLKSLLPEENPNFEKEVGG